MIEIRKCFEIRVKTFRLPEKYFVKNSVALILSNFANRINTMLIPRDFQYHYTNRKFDSLHRSNPFEKKKKCQKFFDRIFLSVQNLPLDR